MIVTLTQAFLNSGPVVPEGKKRLEVCDSVCRGLLVEVRSTAQAIPAWYLRYKRNGKTAYDRLGSIQELTLAQARKLATLRKAEHASEATRVSAPAGMGRSVNRRHAALAGRACSGDTGVFRGGWLRHGTQHVSPKMEPEADEGIHRSALLPAGCSLPLRHRAGDCCLRCCSRLVA